MYWLLAAIGTLGVFLVVAPRPRSDDRPRNTARSIGNWTRRQLNEAGLEGASATTAIGLIAIAALVGAAVGYAMFGGLLPPLATAVTAAALPTASIRNRRLSRRQAASDHWPTLIEEMRVLTAASGRSIPQALIEVGATAPAELRAAFDRARREWVLTTDFERTTEVLKTSLASPSADATLETLLIAHQLGGADLDRRLAELANDRRIDLNDRKDAAARQAGVRFSRKFVVLVPFGMALAGMSLGDGRDAYASATGQIMAAVAIGLVAVCWVWSGHLLKVPEEERVFG